MMHWQQRTKRMIGQDGHPLRRKMDKAESLVFAALVALLMVAAPLAGVFAGRAADSAARHEQQAERGWYPSSAVLLQGAGQAASDQGGTGVVWVRARWTDRDARRHTGTVAAPLSARPGQHVQIWLTLAGQQAHQPLTTADVRDQVTSSVLLAVTGSCVAIGLSVLAVRLLANRRRLIGWQREWDSTGPQWSRQD